MLQFIAIVMNIISATKAYSLFPLSTFIERKGIKILPRKRSAEVALEKYKTRGWTIEKFTTFNCQFQPNRFVGDAISWSVDLNDDHPRIRNLPKRRTATELLRDRYWTYWILHGNMQLVYHKQITGGKHTSDGEKGISIVSNL
jgi:hypothetical protein